MVNSEITIKKENLVVIPIISIIIIFWLLATLSFFFDVNPLESGQANVDDKMFYEKHSDYNDTSECFPDPMYGGCF